MKLFQETKTKIYELYNCFSRRPPKLTTQPKASRETYQNLASVAVEQSYPEIDRFEEKTGHGIEPAWLHDLALHTQVVVKESTLCYAHGRVLYSALSRYLGSIAVSESINILETGTARGFSGLCMAKALNDMGRSGRVVTFDFLPHRSPIYWNCIDDLERKKSREELLAPWSEMVRKYLVFVQGDTQLMLPSVCIDRVHFAFLDGAHTYPDVLFEFAQIAGSQHTGDVAVFDDYTPAQFPGIVAAVDEICNKYGYSPEKLSAHSGRGYVVAIKQ
jgi:predicted O-methyltransferase YrrM